MRKSLIRVFAVLVLVAVAGVPALLAEDADGQALYDKKCAMCHGKDGVAKKMAEGSANLNDDAWQEATSLETIIGVIAQGKGKMPKNEGKLTEAEIKAIAEYVKTL